MKTVDMFLVLMHNILRWNFHILMACAPPKCNEFTYQIKRCDFPNQYLSCINMYVYYLCYIYIQIQYVYAVFKSLK